MYIDIDKNMTLLIRIDHNILDTVLSVELVFELSTVTKAFSFNDKRKLNVHRSPNMSVHFEGSSKCWYFIILACQVILFFVIRPGVKKCPSIFHQHIHQSSFLETVFDILYVLLC